VIFHIAESEDWEAAQKSGVYRASTRGQSLDEVGFIHASRRHQVERVANAVYRQAGPLVLLSIDVDRLGVEVREESGGGVETFPHIYGPVLAGAVVAVEPLRPAPGGLFVPSNSWLSPKLGVRPSRIEGLGLFAMSDIAEGEPVSVLGGRAMTNEEFAAYVATVERWSAAAVDEDLNVVQEDDDPLRRGNHSCDPELWMADELTLVARRAMTLGEEASVDYALMTVDETWIMACRCGRPGCRGSVTGSDWRRADLQARYRGHFSPFIERRISSSQDQH
jgi:uncharacterized protein (DUF952 family)